MSYDRDENVLCHDVGRERRGSTYTTDTLTHRELTRLPEKRVRRFLSMELPSDYTGYYNSSRKAA